MTKRHQYLPLRAMAWQFDVVGPLLQVCVLDQKYLANGNLGWRLRGQAGSPGNLGWPTGGGSIYIHPIAYNLPPASILILDDLLEVRADLKPVLKHWDAELAEVESVACSMADPLNKLFRPYMDDWYKASDIEKATTRCIELVLNQRTQAHLRGLDVSAFDCAFFESHLAELTARGQLACTKLWSLVAKLWTTSIGLEQRLRMTQRFIVERYDIPPVPSPCIKEIIS